MMRRPLQILVVLALSIGFGACQQRNGFAGDVSINSTVAGMPALSGKLYMRGTRLRLEWAQFTDVFDIQQRKGWRIIPAAHGYQELAGKDLSTFAPEMTDGSPCLHAQVPSECRLVGQESVDGRAAKKWDVYNPKGFHVYFWTDDALKITLRMAIGDAASYEVKNLAPSSVSDSAFVIPAGYQKLDRPPTP